MKRWRERLWKKAVKRGVGTIAADKLRRKDDHHEKKIQIYECIIASTYLFFSSTYQAFETRETIKFQRDE